MTECRPTPADPREVAERIVAMGITPGAMLAALSVLEASHKRGVTEPIEFSVQPDGSLRPKLRSVQ